MSVVLSWSGGKDSALGLWTMRAAGTEPVALLTTVNEDHGRISIHGVRRELLHAQAAAVGLPLVEVGIPTGASNALYEERLAAKLTADPHAGAVGPSLAAADRSPADADASLTDADTVAFADLFLADIRAYRERQLAALGRRASFPLWGRDTAALARTFVAAGFGATLVVVDTEQLDPSFVGRRFDAELLRDLPAGVDPCGENGEFHTFVDSGPIFDAPIPVEPGELHDEGRFVYRDLHPA
ncbi:MAG TPA: ATP-binding protein [Solirubrobacterales bacterium]|nr:ATP-binding protein [Solirubrobacterales bacterium]